MSLQWSMGLDKTLIEKLHTQRHITTVALLVVRKYGMESTPKRDDCSALSKTSNYKNPHVIN